MEHHTRKDNYGANEKTEKFSVGGKMVRFKKVCSTHSKSKAEEKKQMLKSKGMLARKEQEASGHWNVYKHMR